MASAFQKLKVLLIPSWELIYLHQEWSIQEPTKAKWLIFTWGPFQLHLDAHLQQMGEKHPGHLMDHSAGSLVPPWAAWPHSWGQQKSVRINMQFLCLFHYLFLISIAATFLLTNRPTPPASLWLRNPVIAVHGFSLVFSSYPLRIRTEHVQKGNEAIASLGLITPCHGLSFSHQNHVFKLFNPFLFEVDKLYRSYFTYIE